MRILIADDNQLVRRGVKSILASETLFEVCGEAEDGEKAVLMARELQPDLVLLDVSMPRQSGLQTARLIRQELPKTKIIVMSQHDPIQLSPRATEAGAHACVDKSRLASDLLMTVKRVGQVN